MNDYFTSKELFLKIMNFEHCKRTLNWEFGYWGGALNRWYKEGLPKMDKHRKKFSYSQSIPGSAVAAGSPSWNGTLPKKDIDVSNYFNFDKGFSLVPYHYWIFPLFEKIIFFEDDRYIELKDVDGIRKKILKDDPYGAPFFIKWPVENRNDWEKVKEERFNFNNIGKRFVGNIKDFIKRSNDITSPFGLLDAPCGFFGSLRFLIGDENLFLLYYDDPELVNNILDHLCDLWISIAEELTAKMDFDLVCFWEDMAGKQGSLISPLAFREFMTPRYKRIIDFMKSKGISLFLVDNDGKVEQLIPLFLEAGINIIYPFEQQAENEMISIRKKYPQLGMIGGFDKNALYKGKEYIDKELEKMPYLISKGGFIPCADHLIPPNVPWENFKYYRNKLLEIFEHTEISLSD